MGDRIEVLQLAIERETNLVKRRKLEMDLTDLLLGDFECDCCEYDNEFDVNYFC